MNQVPQDATPTMPAMRCAPPAAPGHRHAALVLGALALALATLLPVRAGDAGAQAAFTEADIKASRIVLQAPGGLAATPAALFQGVDMMNLFIVAEPVDGQVTVLDGDRLEPVHRFTPRQRLHGEPTFTPDGRYLFFASHDGWITKFDIWNLQTVAEVRAGIETRTLTISHDGKYLAKASPRPRPSSRGEGRRNRNSGRAS